MRLPDRSIASVVGTGATLAGILAVFTYTGGSLRGPVPDEQQDEVARKQFLRKHRRHSFQDTIDELGEGRGEFCTVPILAEGKESRTPNAERYPKRYLRPWLRGAAAAEAEGEVWHRRARGSVDCAIEAGEV